MMEGRSKKGNIYVLKGMGGKGGVGGGCYFHKSEVVLMVCVYKY